MGMQVTGKADFIAQYLESGDLYGMIVSIIKNNAGCTCYHGSCVADDGCFLCDLV